MRPTDYGVRLAASETIATRRSRLSPGPKRAQEPDNQYGGQDAPQIVCLFWPVRKGLPPKQRRPTIRKPKDARYERVRFDQGRSDPHDGDDVEDLVIRPQIDGRDKATGMMILKASHGVRTLWLRQSKSCPGRSTTLAEASPPRRIHVHGST